MRFRLDSWWFGVPLLTRGPLISLPIVLATDYQSIQTMFVTLILAAFLVIQAMAWPWKAGILNLRASEIFSSRFEGPHAECFGLLDVILHPCPRGRYGALCGTCVQRRLCPSCPEHVTKGLTANFVDAFSVTIMARSFELYIYIRLYMLF